MLACDLGRGHLPQKLRAGHELGLGAWARSLLELLLSPGPLGTAEAQGYVWLLQKHLEAEAKRFLGWDHSAFTGLHLLCVACPWQDGSFLTPSDLPGEVHPLD